MGEDINGEIGEPDQCWMEECSKRIENDCGKDVVLAMDPFAYLLVQFVKFIKQSHYIISQLTSQRF